MRNMMRATLREQDTGVTEELRSVAIRTRCLEERLSGRNRRCAYQIRAAALSATRADVAPVAFAAKLANELAHNLEVLQPDESRTAFELKTQLLAAVLVGFRAAVDITGVRPDGAVGLTIRFVSGCVRLHTYPWHLSARAQAIVREKTESLPVVFPLLAQGLAAALAA